MDPNEFQEIRQALTGFSVILATSPLDHESAWVEVFPRGVCKSRSAQWLASRLGIEQKDVAAVGNDYNDQDLLEWAGQAFVVENAPGYEERVPGGPIQQPLRGQAGGQGGAAAGMTAV